jgi:aspartyl-tRNA(Asn)/glutamyl-tRNA(Gln) amidotransferase subunit A
LSELWGRSAGQLAAAVRGGDVSAAQVVDAFLERSESVDPLLRCFVRLDAQAARARAAEIDRKRAAGVPLGALAGVPVALKDNLAVAGRALTCGSRVLDGYVSPYSATVVEKLEAADAVLFGHTNMDEFAMGSSCESSAYGPTRNPWDLERVPGGSSGGSAAAVAARCVPLAFGSDTGGSIRQPAALCGVVGLKPTYGRVSRYGLVAFASSLDQVGPLAGSVADAALALQVIAGHDPRDATSAARPVGDYAASSGGVEGLRAGVPRELAVGRLDPDVRADWERALARLQGLGVRLVEVSVPALEAANAVYYVLANSEASANLARFDGVRYGHRTREAGTLAGLYQRSRSEGFGPEVKRRILLGTFALSSGYYEAYYGRAAALARALGRELSTALESCDLLLAPASPFPAFRLGERSDPLAMYLSDVYTVPANLAGLPAVAVPSGRSASGLPLALQLMGRGFDEARLLQAAAAFAAATDFERPLLPDAARGGFAEGAE